jgi:hypothetical protein
MPPVGCGGEVRAAARVVSAGPLGDGRYVAGMALVDET